MKRLENKIALITGSANGIGKAAALKFAEEGAAVAVVDIDDKAGQEVVSEIKHKGRQAFFLKCDVSNITEVKNVVDTVANKYNALNILYNNASVYLPKEDGSITDISEVTWEKVIGINLKSVFCFCKYALPLIIKSGGGSIINTASSAGVIGIPNCDAYTAAKGATIALTRSMAVEFGPQNIRVNCISPAAIKTPMLAQSNPKGDNFDEERFLGLRTPLRRYGKPEEIANLAVFLASDESSYLNGAILVADGGITINGDLSKLS
ncbi:MAG TPA: short-chain dehydrogenase [Phycisphaerales bacterium]|nr:short-chain dehydrogenase [Phycisphaerales bacterium]